MLSAMKIWHKIRYDNGRERQAQERGHAIPEHLGTLWRLRKSRAAGKGAQQKE
jgi:hypothetical protein